MNRIFLEEISEGLSPEDYLENKDELIELVENYNTAKTENEQVSIEEQLYAKLQDIRCSDSSCGLNGKTTLRYEFAKIGGGKYRDEE